MPGHYRVSVFALACLAFGWAVSAWGGETRRQQLILGDNTERIFIEGIRPQGMGGAFTAVANDENAMFYNPAGLARVEYWRFTFPKLLVGTDIRSFDNLMYLMENSGAFQQFMNGSLTPETAQTVDQLSHERIHALLQASMTYVQPSFATGIWLFQEELVETGAILLPEAYWNLRAGLIENLSWGFGWDISGFGYLAAGFTLKATQQMKSLEENVSVLDLSQPTMVTQWGGGLDLGFLYQPTEEITVALVMADIYSRLLDEVITPNLKLGFAYEPWWLNFEDLQAVLAVDVVELNWQGDNEFRNNANNATAINMSKFRVGLEFVLSGLIALRGGMSQGYPTAGLSLTTSFVTIDYAYFGRELGTYPGQNPEWNQRISIDWHTGAPAPRATPTPTATPTTTATPTVTVTPTPRPRAQPTFTGNVPKLHGTFVGFTGTVTIVPKIPEDVGTINTWALQISDRNGRVLKRFLGSGNPDPSFTWNAKEGSRRVPSKEQYPYSLDLRTVDGATRTVSGTLVIVDTIPKLYTSKNYEVYPDKVYFSIANPVKGTKEWKLDIFDASNQVIRSYRSQEELFKAYVWDSKDENATVVPNNGTYRYELSYLEGDGSQILIADKLRPVLGQVYPNENRMTIKVGEILFDTGKAFLTAEMFDKVIKSSFLIQDAPSCDALLEGHTDSTGSKSLNMKLSLVRAESVRRFMVGEQNVSDYQLAINGWGPTKPIATNRTADGRTRNRRVEVIIRIPE
jgi:outer membrane protein OmpA-like peptidoglycan-associated protein